MTEDVIINFVPDFSKLDTALDQLGKEGKVDASAFQSIQKAIDATATDTKGLITEFKKVAGTAVAMGKSVENAFGAGIQDALDEAGVSVKDFGSALAKANAPAKTLKAELRELKEALALMKANGKDAGSEFEALRARAGKLSDAIKDAGEEIKNAGSDTRNIDNVVGSISALAGGFAAAQGAIALFGEEDKDLQKALLKVNGAMALASGLQQFYNATLKEGAITKLADSIATGAQSAAMTLYTFVTNGATIATKVFRAALIATGIGAIVVLLIAVADAMNVFDDSTEDTTASLKEQKEAADNLVSSLEDVSSAAADARAAQAGGSDDIKRQITLAKAKGANSKEVFDLEQKLRRQEIRELKILGETYIGEYNVRKQLGTLTAADAEALSKKIAEINKQGQDKSTEITAAEFEFTRDRNKEIEDAAKKASEEKLKRLAKERAARLAELNDNLAFLQRDLLAATKGSDIELELKKKVIRAKRDIELEGEKVTATQALLIKAQALHDQIELQKDFNKKLTTDQLQAQIDNNAAILAGISINNEERLRLQIENINTSAQLEVNAAEGNASKILLIEAKKQADIRALKNKAIDDDLAAQLNSVSLTNKIIKDGLTKLAADQSKSTSEKIAALKSIETQELLEVDKKIEANKKKEQSDEEYKANLQKLSDEMVEIEGNTAAKIKDINEQEKQTRIENLKAVADEAIMVASAVSDFFNQLATLASEQDRQRIDLQKQQLQALIDAGAITAKEAKIRGQQLEIQERQAKQRAAQREKQSALFTAIINTAAGIAKAIPNVFLMALAAAVGATQVALISSRPVPKFFRGKKGNYEGPAEVGEMGAELVERNGRMFLYTNPTKTYLHAKDKVYTASETRNILHNTNVNTNIPVVKAEKFDYAKLAKSIPKSSFNVNIDKDFISESVANGLSKNNYFNNRYSFKK